MSYTLLAGAFVIRYPDLPRSGPEPDGDTVKFRPGHPGRWSRRCPGPPAGRRTSTPRVSVRLEAIDALETHFAETHQELAGANAARDELLERARLPPTSCFFDDQPNKVQSADQDPLRGHVLTQRDRRRRAA